MRVAVTQALLDWYGKQRRPLPWRATRDPYCIWVSEVMLQQTQVATVIGFYERWLRRFPDVATLASAETEDVLRAWEGLGYYSRARNLQRAAQNIVEQHGGQLPASVTQLLELPGIGPYTAAAIASIAFSEPVTGARRQRRAGALRLCAPGPRARRSGAIAGASLHWRPSFSTASARATATRR